MARLHHLALIGVLVCQCRTTDVEVYDPASQTHISDVGVFLESLDRKVIRCAEGTVLTFDLQRVPESWVLRITAEDGLSKLLTVDSQTMRERGLSLRTAVDRSERPFRRYELAVDADRELWRRLKDGPVRGGFRLSGARFAVVYIDGLRRPTEIMNCQDAVAAVAE